MFQKIKLEEHIDTVLKKSLKTISGSSPFHEFSDTWL